MKRHLTLLFICLSSACFSQQFIKINNTGQTKLLGTFQKDLLLDEPFTEWFSPNYDTFNIDKSQLRSVSKNISKVDSIDVFLGTWCGDSKREVPRFIKIMDALGYDKIKLIGLDNTFQNYKQSPFGEESDLNIHRVPTFIFYQDSVELNRIVESPKTDWAQDLNELLTESYTPNYQIVHELNELFKIKGNDFIEKNIETIAADWVNKVENTSVLNTYGYKLFTSFKLAEAELVFQLNCLLYPNECRPLLTMGRYYLRLGEVELAKLQFESGLKINPDHEDLNHELGKL